MVTVFVWEMFKTGVGHASMFVNGPSGKAYISWWPSASTDELHKASNGVFSAGLVHSMHSDIKHEQGNADWASKPLVDLDENKIIKWWNQIAASPNLTTGEEPAKAGNYTFLSNNCSTTVMRALRIGATAERRNQIDSYFLKSMRFGPTQNLERFAERAVPKLVANVGSGGAIFRSALETAVDNVARGVVVAPYDCRNVVENW
jgi:hypothetical protein